MITTIDGPTASGKSTVGRLLAQELGYYYLYTGLLYRALAYLLMKDYGYTLETIAAPEMPLVEKLVEKFVYRYEPDDRERIFFDGTDLTLSLNRDEIGQGASIVSTNPAVRKSLNSMQRAIANDHDVVIDGRDSGSVVFPHADHKFFLTASVDERARRWQRQQERRGEEISLEEAKKFIQMRDTRDANRQVAPMIIPKGAIEIDGTDLSIEQVLEAIQSEVLKC